MAAENRNTAYDFSLFEEAPEVKKAPRKNKQKNKTKEVIVISNEVLDKVGRRKVNPFRVVTTALFGGMVAFLLIVNIFGRLDLIKQNQMIQSKQAELVQQQSIYTQANMNISERYSSAEIEEYARTVLSMSRCTNSQKESVYLSDGDKAEVMDTEDNNIFINVINAVKEILS